MTTADLARETAAHRRRVVEIKANLHDIDARRAELARELEDEEQIVATLDAVARAAPDDEHEEPAPAAPARRRRSQPEG